MSYLNPSQSRLRDDIRGLIKGDVRCDEIACQLYSTDAGILEVRPQGVVWPRSIDDVVACVQYASERALTIHARGFGTGLSGESLGPGLILDFTRYMRRLLSLDRDSVTVQCGISQSRLNGVLRRYQNRCFGPVSPFYPATTVGSILARNGAGPLWLQYGFPSNHVQEITVVRANGEVLTLNRRSLPQALEHHEEGHASNSQGKISNQEDRVARGITLARQIVLGKEHALADEVYRVLNGLESELESLASFPEVNRAGYHLHDILKGTDGRHVDLARLLIGSEGTLGLFVEAKLDTVELPHRGAAAILFFNGLESAARAVERIFPFRPIFCELVDRRRIELIRQWYPPFQNILPTEAEAALLVELDSGTIAHPVSSTEMDNRLAQLTEKVCYESSLCFHVVRIQSPETFGHFDELVRCAEQVLFRMRRSFQPLPLFEDIAVPVNLIGDFMLDLLALLRRHEITASISGHLGQGHLRVHPIVDLARRDLAICLYRLAEDVYILVNSYRGTISSEAGTGLLKSVFIPLQYKHAAPIFHKIKSIFDPNNLLNPGKVVPDATPWTDRLRTGLSNRGLDHPLPTNEESAIQAFPSQVRFRDEAIEPEPVGEKPEFSSQLELQLEWHPEYIFESTHLCNGCGDCMYMDRRTRMCPMFKRHLIEEAAPRSKANLLRGILEGKLDLSTLTLEDAKEIADYCIHCRMCTVECPAEVNVSQLAFQCKSAHVAAHGMPLSNLLLSRAESVLPWLAWVRYPINRLLTGRLSRWMLEKTLGIPQGRKLPSLAKASFLNKSQWSPRWSRLQPGAKAKVALFVDLYANYFETKIADLAIRLLEQNEISVFIPPRQRPSGLTALSVGDRTHFQQLARHNTLLLADLIRQGYQIVTLEPNSASCLTQDYREVIDDIDTALLMSNTVDVCQYLLQLHRQDRLKLDFKPVKRSVAYHTPCRTIYGSAGHNNRTPAEELIRLIPELKVKHLECGCCGMAGTFGLNVRNYQKSLQIGLPLFKALRLKEIDFGVSDCSACMMQMEQGSKKPALHPIHLLAASAFGYGKLVTSD